MIRPDSTMRAAVLAAPEHIGIQQLERPQPPEGWSLIRVEYTGLCGTDFSIFHGSHPRAQSPLTMGHEITGVVEISTADGPAVGTRVVVEPLISCGKCGPCRRGETHVCRNLGLFGIDMAGSLADYVQLPNSSLIAVPSTVPALRAVLTEPLAVAVHAVARSRMRPGDRVVIFGAGPIGTLTALVARNEGAGEVIVVEPSAERSAFAASLGFTVTAHGSDALTEILALTDGEGADLVFDTAAHPTVAAVLPFATRVGGTIVLVGVYKKPTEVDLQAITFAEHMIIGVRVYTRADIERAAELVTNDVLNLDRIPLEVFELEETTAGFETAMSAGAALKVLISSKRGQ